MTRRCRNQGRRSATHTPGREGHDDLVPGRGEGVATGNRGGGERLTNVGIRGGGQQLTGAGVLLAWCWI
jgi:hypothetical protein